MERYSYSMSPNSRRLSCLSFAATSTAILLVLWAISSMLPIRHGLVETVKKANLTIRSISYNIVQDVDAICNNLEQTTFYDEPGFSYSLDRPTKNWDKKRRDWLKSHPSFAIGARDRMLIVTGSQPGPCKGPLGDHLLLRFFKNKIDYSRINGYDVFYNNAFLHPEMGAHWAKISVIWASMLAHPEAEWIWWVDADAVFTDMDFQPPLKKYNNYNLVIGGSPKWVYENPSWLGLNNGVFYLRNCQWSIDFLQEWAKMGPQTPHYKDLGQVLGSTFKDNMYPKEVSDQTAMVYLLLKQRGKWGDKVLLEQENCIQGYWEEVIGSYDNVTKNYMDLEKTEKKLKRRHAEKVNRAYSALWEKYLDKAGYKKGAGKRYCITHFSGCNPCVGKHNPNYTAEACRNGIEKALNFADNQVLRNYGFSHSNLDSSSLSNVQF